MVNIDWKQLIAVEAKVIKIQAFFRGQLTLKRLERQAISVKAKISQTSSKIPERIALEHFVFQLKSKGLTAEAFFRICDTQYNYYVTVESFRQKLQSLKLKLSNT